MAFWFADCYPPLKETHKALSIAHPLQTNLISFKFHWLSLLLYITIIVSIHASTLEANNVEGKKKTDVQASLKGLWLKLHLHGISQGQT